MKAGLELFRSSVRPVLIQQCLKCHGAGKPRGNFDLATREALLDSGMVEKDADSSWLIQVIRHAEEPHMPKDGPKLPDEQVARIADWINLGAPYDRPLIEGRQPKPAKSKVADPGDLWSLGPLSLVPIPLTKSRDWARTPVDPFILARIESAGLSPAPEADRRVLIRRATFDLLGLPPTPEEVNAFVNDPDSDAYARLVDRLLASPRFGERWARHWMDVARFAESHGYEQDYDRPNAYHYRDFLIRAINGDLPFDAFLGWQLAGDELAPDNPLAMMATGFLGGGAFPTQLTEAEFESARYDELDDMTATTSVAFLGLSVGCARCHDHKFDPIPSEDYYRLASTFTTTIRSEIDLPVIPNSTPAKVQVTSEGLPPMKHHADDRGFPHFYRETHFLQRGDVNQKKGVASPGFLHAVMTLNGSPGEGEAVQVSATSRTSGRRAALARWMTDVDHGAGRLVARVAVNRLWQHHFGRGLVATPNDFGSQGAPPTHPELLDYLAKDLIDHQWQLKRLHRLLLTSAVYMQENAENEAFASIDRDNLLWWHRPLRRMEAEAIRDSTLYVADQLDQQMYGPGTLDAAMPRRSVYFFIKRSKLIPMMMLFDWPEHLVSIGQRSQTTIAPQALAFLNSPQIRGQAEGLARQRDEASPEESLRRIYARLFHRAPTSAEVDALLAYVQRQSESYQQAGATNPTHSAWVDLCQALFCTNEFLYVE